MFSFALQSKMVTSFARALRAEMKAISCPPRGRRERPLSSVLGGVEDLGQLTGDNSKIGATIGVAQTAPLDQTSQVLVGCGALRKLRAVAVGNMPCHAPGLDLCIGHRACVTERVMAIRSSSLHGVLCHCAVREMRLPVVISNKTRPKEKTSDFRL